MAGTREGAGDSVAVFDGVKGELETELKAVIEVRNYFATLQGVFGNASQVGRVDVNSIGEAILRDLRPEEAESKASMLEFLGKIASLSGVAVGGRKFGKVLGTVFSP